jgi:SAM-dependent methyltransferase
MGYDVTGLDGSAEMLEYARVNSGWSEFVHADARSFDPAGVTGGPAGFDAVLSPFDSLNHIMSVEELREVFLRVRAVLRPGGLFLFDLNIEDEEELRGSSFDIVGVDHACIMRSSYDQLKRLKRYDLTMFRLEDGHYQRTDLALYQRYHTTETVLGILGETGFDRIRIFDARADFGVARRDCRIYYLAG